MQSSYFKIRKRFDFSPHRYEIGPPFINSNFIENHFLLKVYKLSEMEYEAFYQFHLDNYLESNPDQQESFFSYVSEIVENRIQFFQRLDPFSSKHVSNKVNIQKLKNFREFLVFIDQWKKQQPLESVVAEKDQQITELKARIAVLEEQVGLFKELEPSKKIQIRENYLPTFLDLIKQMQELELPDGNKLLTSYGQSSWYKMIAKYFLHGSNEIPVNTARNYFPAQKDKTLIKGTEIYSSQKLFKINHLKRNG